MAIPRWPAVVRLLRRTHLFAGLTLCPWVALYGATALLFNHPGLAAGPTPRAWRPFGHVAGSRMPPAASWAASLVDSLNLEAGRSGTAFRLVDADSAVEYGGLQFMMAAGDTVYRMSYDARAGTLTGRPGAADRQLSTRNFLTALHTTRGYPDGKSEDRADERVAGSPVSRWGWALVVDAMGLLMLFWACSGLAMWWQVRSLRTIGGLVLGASATVAAVLATGLHRALTGG